ncbi:DNA-3-methyladenine glycosylase family protein [Paenibacillus elgii]|uniref:DNA-3-methyladenine glycosylase family protein n=1 Tax=Paenibacillus elgii TaxID=189691 RepID=UPI0013D29A14|nr:DNA-3-methyladenine glycosylase [Paenibacillus elgii]
MMNEAQLAAELAFQEGWKDGGNDGELIPRGPFRFSAALAYMGRSENECLFYVNQDQDRVYKWIEAGSERVLVEIFGGSEDRTVRLRFLDEAAHENPQARLAAARYVWEWFDLGTDLDAFYRLAENDLLLGPLAHRFYGLRCIGIPDLFEALCWAILGQQINLAFAYTLKRRFVESYGASMAWDGRKFWTFPAPEAIAGLSVADLTPLQLTSKKAEYVLETAARMADGRLTKERLLRLGDAEAVERELTAVRGIGPWTAHYVMMRCLRLPSAFPAGDVGLQNAVKHLFGMDSKPTPAELRRLAAGWSGFEAYATFYLWRVLY